MKNRSLRDAFWLVIVRIITIGIGIVSTRLLSDALPMEVYGTYSQLNTLIDTATSLTILGMSDAANYFFGRARDTKQYRYIDTIFSVQIVIGVSDALIILLMKNIWGELFSNTLLANYIIWIALRPLLNNLIAMFSVLHVAIGNARAIALRNTLFSIFKLIGVCVTVRFNSLELIFVIFLLFDVISVIVFWSMYKFDGHLLSFYLNKSYIKEIFRFSIPMGAFILVNGLFRNTDKFVISIFESPEKVAIYTNGSTQLPFDIIWTSSLTIIAPIITNQIMNRAYNRARKTYFTYIKISAFFTIPMTIVAIICARELVTILYGNKYFDSAVILQLYVITDAIKYLGSSIVLSAATQSKKLLKIAIVMLGINLILDILFIKSVGLVGPAIATVIVSVLLNIAIFAASLKCLHFRIKNLRVGKSVIKICLSFFLTSILVYVIHERLQVFTGSPIIIIIISSLSAVLIIAFMNLREIKKLFIEFNKLRI